MSAIGPSPGEGERAPATADLVALLYDELRALARARLANDPAGQTIQATVLVHEAYLRLASPDGGHRWDGPGHYFAAAAEAMRRILIDRARHKRTLKAGGGRGPVGLAEVDVAAPEPGVDLLELDEALSRLEAVDRRKADVVKLRFFAGLTNAEAADALGISPSLAEKDWAFARCWLRVEMQDATGRSGGG